MLKFFKKLVKVNGKSGARVAPKRPQSSPDHGIVSPASTSPPTKVLIHDHPSSSRHPSPLENFLKPPLNRTSRQQFLDQMCR
ncbi:hypothetical protein GWI33_006401 [Rhynchophorus ferrugineus]|uniref:Uncharacterized protein n=1 Tax=Rhynchophorus ferrugineus TaxID=354439 RepID=A0A834IHQ4_RHYFE|nr:hypothetical protein GWI33_006401 [Rhynchophorus ferrugineus]